MVTCELYQPHNKSEWDGFVIESKTPIFLFIRDYMEYHSDRFNDCSLLFRDEGVLVGVLPASIADNVISCHGGLTFGALLLSSKTKISTTLEIFNALVQYARSHSVSKILYKAIPYIFSNQPAEEDLYGLCRVGAKLVRRDFSSIIRLDARLKLSKGRKWLIARAKKNGLSVSNSNDWAGFVELLAETLTKHGARPVHTASELKRLSQRFDKNIFLKTIEVNGEMVAAVVLFKFSTVVHTQYIASTESGREMGALDFLIEACIDEAHADGLPYFSFGISTEDHGRYLNDGLVAQKESFGARGMAVDFYGIDIE